MTPYRVIKRLNQLEELCFFAEDGYQSKLSLAETPPLILSVIKLHTFISAKKDILTTAYYHHSSSYQWKPRHQPQQLHL